VHRLKEVRRMSSQTIFMSVPSASAVVYRVETESGAYLLGLQGADGRRSVLVRGAPGTKHEHVVLGDTAPQVGTRSLWEVPVADWPGHPLTVATMTTSRIRTVTRETDPGTVHALGRPGGAKLGARLGDDGEGAERAGWQRELRVEVSGDPHGLDLVGQCVGGTEAGLLEEAQHVGRRGRGRRRRGVGADLRVASVAGGGEGERPEPPAAGSHGASFGGLRDPTGRREVKLILCDVLMPELSGSELLLALLRAAPWSADRLLFMTGGAPSSEMEKVRKVYRGLILQKPFDVATLIAALASMGFADR
jgi:CheY-like chemotaxis protein